MNVFELMGRLVLDRSEYDEGLDEAEKETSGFGDKIKKGLGVAGKAVGGALIAGAGAAIALTKQAVDAYGNYEQLAGGIETLFGDSADVVMEHASKAFQTAGMSANQYMENVMGFSAALIQATGRGEQVDLEQLEATLDEEYKATKRAQEDMLTERKQYWDDVIATAKKNKDPQLDALKKQKDAELTELKRANQDALEELKQHNKEVLAETEATNMKSSKTPESLAKAAELSDMALQDMSDNANKMGTNIQAITNAYQGFAKQNYTMLDNLKLGYGGTKEEMERLLEDAERIKAEQGEVAEFSIGSYADIVEAIHVVQGEMGITGTTASEAAGTIQGSMGAMKAAWENLVGGFANPEADIGQLVMDFVNSATGALQNLIPTITNALKGIAKALLELAKALIAELPSFISEVLPSLIETATTIVVELAKALPDILKSLVDMIPEIVPMLINAMIDIAEALVDNIDSLVDCFIQLMIGITEVIIEVLPILIERLPEILMKIGEAIITNAPVLLEAIVQCVVMLATALWELLAQGYAKINEWFTNLITGISEWLSALPERMAYWAGQAVGNMVKFFMELPEKIKKFLKEVPPKIKEMGVNMVQNAKQAAKDFVKNLLDGLRELPEKVKDIGKNIVDGLKNGIIEKWENFKESISNLAGKFIDGFKGVFGINSPSKVFAEIGGYMAEGLGVGWDKEFDTVKRNIENVSLDMNVSAKAAKAHVTTRNSDKPVVIENHVYLEGDAKGVFKIVKEQNKINTRATGYNALAMT